LDKYFGTIWGTEKCMQNFSRKNVKGRDHLGCLDVDGMVTLKLIYKNWGSMFIDWIHLAQDRVQWRAL
jgi:hypothetical protein